LDPGYSNAYVALAWTYNHDVRFGWTKRPKKSINLMLENTQKAVSLDESNANAYAILEEVYRHLRMFDKALATGKKAIALAPNGADVNALHTSTLLLLGKYEEALAIINKAIGLNPITPIYYRLAEGAANLSLGRHDKAIVAYKKALRVNPDYFPAHVALVVAYSHGGKEEKARAQAREVLRIDPNFSVDWYVKNALSISKKDRHDFYANALKNAGLN
jgi:tetratricopeptide (TPR) repeat protein